MEQYAVALGKGGELNVPIRKSTAVSGQNRTAERPARQNGDVPARRPKLQKDINRQRSNPLPVFSDYP